MTFAFISGHPALDLAGTLKWRRDEPEELLASPADWDRWLNEAGLSVTGPRPHQRANQAELESAVALREAIYRLTVDGSHGRAGRAADLDHLNAVAAVAPTTVELTPSGVQRHGDNDAVLSEIARSYINLVSEAEAPPVKECGRANCTRLYLDRSRGARRTWCGMGECGNRVKAAAYRARKKAAVAGPAPHPH